MSGFLTPSCVAIARQFMQVTELTALAVRVPLKRRIKHASADRRQSENLLIRCQLEDGTCGWGEGVPRTYVTGESVDGSLQQLVDTRLDGQLDRDCGSWQDVIAMCLDLKLASCNDDPRGSYGNALRCAVELSLLDAYGKLFDEPVSAVTRHFDPAAPLCRSNPLAHYSAVITAAGGCAELISALKMRLYGFRHCKVKVAVEHDDDQQRIRRIRRWIGSGMDLRVDANEGWSSNEVAARLEPLLSYRISSVEQPVRHEEVASLAELRQQLSVPMMLDESLTSRRDAESAIRDRTCDLFNIRLSKCGGFLNSLQLARVARDAGLGYQLGCHPGETGILSAAGRHWATSVADIRYLEGSYDRHLLSELFTCQDITFGYGGSAAELAGPGLGVSIRADVVERHTTERQVFSLA